MVICRDQREVRTSEYSRRLMDTFRDRIGVKDFEKVMEFATWLAQHPKRRDICCFLQDQVGQESEAEAPTDE